MITKIGIYGVSTQSGMAYLADFLKRGYVVHGYARASEHGTAIVDCINIKKGIWLERPDNQNEERSCFIDLGGSRVDHDLSSMIDKVDIILVPIPSHFQIDAVQKMIKVGLLDRKVPIILSPARTCATPYLWNLLKYGYPVLCFATSPYSAKAYGNGGVFIKRRKRTWVASIEGRFDSEQIHLIKQVFPQAALTEIPALTSLNNIGAILHPATFILNHNEILKRETERREYSFYIEGIVQNPKVADVVHRIDQIRLEIAHRLGLETFGLDANPRDDIWRKLINGLRALEQEHEHEIDALRRIRKQFMEYINSCVLSVYHWLDITYGVERIPGESLSSAIQRTPTYQSKSYPQLRYVEEDIPTGLVPLEALADRLGIEHSIISEIINSYDKIYKKQSRLVGRSLIEFSDTYLFSYLLQGYQEQYNEDSI